MTFRTATQTEYMRGIELRRLDTQIGSLLFSIGQMEARLRRDGELSHANAHELNEYRVELIQRRKRYAELIGSGFHRDVFRGRLRHDLKSATHVIVGDHDPEPKQRRRA